MVVVILSQAFINYHRFKFSNDNCPFNSELSCLLHTTPKLITWSLHATLIQHNCKFYNYDVSVKKTKSISMIFMLQKELVFAYQLPEKGFPLLLRDIYSSQSSDLYCPIYVLPRILMHIWTWAVRFKSNGWNRLLHATAWFCYRRESGSMDTLESWDIKKGRKGKTNLKCCYF